MILYVKSSQKGFTLIELAVVVVIIGLLVGGILAGQELIRGAEMRANVGQLTEYKTAIAHFEDKYAGLPGDITNATSLWATAAGNGDGDGVIVWSGEGFLAWNHLSLASLIAGRYTGTASSNRSVLDVNTPRMKRPVNTGVNLIFVNATSFPALWWGAQSGGHALMWGAVDTTGGSTSVQALSSTEAAELDRKMDDGKPDFGVVQSNNNTACTTAAASPAEYAAGGTAAACVLSVKAP